MAHIMFLIHKRIIGDLVTFQKYIEHARKDKLTIYYTLVRLLPKSLMQKTQVDLGELISNNSGLIHREQWGWHSMYKCILCNNRWVRSTDSWHYSLIYSLHSQSQIYMKKWVLYTCSILFFTNQSGLVAQIFKQTYSAQSTWHSPCRWY